MRNINQITQTDIDVFEQDLKVWEDMSDNPLYESPNTADLYQRISTKSALYPGQGTQLGLTYAALKLNGEAGELAEHVGKAMRDDGMMNGLYVDNGCVQSEGIALTPERRELIIKEIGDCLWYLSALCNELKITLAYAMLCNLKKLASRTANKTLRGSGDNR